MIYITGDLHADLGKREKIFRTFSKDDILIVLGDFGYSWNMLTKKIWDNYKFPFTTLSVLGNHENYSVIYDILPKTEKFGGTVYQFNDNTFYLKNGVVYNIEELSFLNFGGALSIDWAYRIPGISWWEEEIPTQAQYLNAMQRAKTKDIDILLSHGCSSTELDVMFNPIYKGPDPVQKMLENIINELRLQDCFRYHLFGHMHKNISEEWDTYTSMCLYDDVKVLYGGEVCDGKSKTLG